jgi:hypothetical protein
MSHPTPNLQQIDWEQILRPPRWWPQGDPAPDWFRQHLDPHQMITITEGQLELKNAVMKAEHDYVTAVHNAQMTFNAKVSEVIKAAKTKVTAQK